MLLENKLYQNDVRSIANTNIDWSILRDSTILITGASGMINSALIDVLMCRNVVFHDNIHILGVGRNESKFWKRFIAYKDNPEFEFVACDINKGISYGYDVDYIINGASNTHPVAYAKEPINTVLTNIIGTNNVLDFAVKKNVRRVVQMSSVEIYGENIGSNDEFSEADCGYINCNTMRAGYPESKRASEALCQAYIAQHGLDVVIARPCRIYGPTMVEDDSKASAQFIRNVLAGEDIVLKSKGQQRFSYCYMMDVASALLFILCKGSCGEAYNISDRNSVITLYNFAKIAAEQNGKKVVFDLPSDTERTGCSKVMKSILNSEKLEELGWSAQTDIAEGLKKTVNILEGLRGGL